MIPILGPADPFPPADTALDEPNGLLAAGADLSVPRLLDAYAHGIFPWFNAGDPVLWWSPDPRMVLFVDEMRISRSLLRRLRRGGFRVTSDTAFDEVLAGCAGPRRDGPGTWIVPAMQRAYLRLHRTGVAHSVEVWHEDGLAGGLYGVSLGRTFFGESMFSRRTDASKVALASLAAQLARWRVPVIDCQMPTAHLASLGAREIPRRAFLEHLGPLVAEGGPPPGDWTLDADLAATWARGRAGAPAT